MPKTLLAVDDSLTMRKVLEITFSGEDFQVITAEGSEDALTKLSEQPKVCVIDTALGSDDGYALCKEIRKREPNATLILLSSRHNQYDQAKGKDAGADDFMDKPFDTQQMIDKVRKAMLAKGEAPAEKAAPAPAEKAAAKGGAGIGAVPPIQQRSTQPSLGAGTGTRQRAATLMFGHEPTTGKVDVVDAPASAPVSAPASAAAAAPAPAAAATAAASSQATSTVAAKPAEVRHNTPMPPTPASNAPPATVAATPAAMHGINGHLAGKLEGLGLTQSQADAVMALSRDVVEKVVWEVVPVIAEALIKEEIARLMKVEKES